MNFYDELDEVPFNYPIEKIKRRGIKTVEADEIIQNELMIPNAIYVNGYFEGVFIAEKRPLVNRILNVELSYEVGKDFYACSIYDESESNGIVLKASNSGIKELVEIGDLGEELKKDIKKIFEREAENICVITRRLSEL